MTKTPQHRLHSSRRIHNATILLLIASFVAGMIWTSARPSRPDFRAPTVREGEPLEAAPQQIPVEPRLEISLRRDKSAYSQTQHGEYPSGWIILPCPDYTFMCQAEPGEPQLGEGWQKHLYSPSHNIMVALPGLYHVASVTATLAATSTASMALGYLARIAVADARFLCASRQSAPWQGT